MTSILIDLYKHDIYCDSKWSTDRGDFGLDAQKMFTYTDMGIAMVSCGEYEVSKIAAKILARFDQMSGEIGKSIFSTDSFISLLGEDIKKKLKCHLFGGINTSVVLCFYRNNDGYGRMPTVKISIKRKSTTLLQDFFYMENKLSISAFTTEARKDATRVALGSGAEFIVDKSEETKDPHQLMMAAYSGDSAHTGGELIQLSKILRDIKPCWYDQWLYDDL